MNDRIVYIVKKDINIFQKNGFPKGGGKCFQRGAPNCIPPPPSTHMLSYTPLMVMEQDRCKYSAELFQPFLRNCKGKLKGIG